MTTIPGKVVLTCPETGKEVMLHKECTNKDGKGNNCPHFKHFAIHGNKINITCKWEPKHET